MTELLTYCDRPSNLQLDFVLYPALPYKYEEHMMISNNGGDYFYMSRNPKGDISMHTFVGDFFENPLFYICGQIYDLKNGIIKISSRLQKPGRGNLFVPSELNCFTSSYPKYLKSALHFNTVSIVFTDLYPKHDLIKLPMEI